MNEKFFSDYKKFIVKPVDEKPDGKEGFDPENYASHYILTLSLFDSRITTWMDTGKYGIDIENGINAVLKEFNKKQYETYRLQLLELDQSKNYFVLALSSKIKFEPEEEQDRVSLIVDKILTNPFYVGQQWFNLIGEKGKVERKLFYCSFKKYIIEQQEHSNKDKKYEKISEFIPKNGEIKLIKSL